MTSTEPSEPETIEDAHSPAQEGLIESCVAYHKAAKGETYAKVVSNYGTFDFDTFYKWNPAIGKGRTKLLVNYNVCVGV